MNIIWKLIRWINIKLYKNKRYSKLNFNEKIHEITKNFKPKIKKIVIPDDWMNDSDAFNTWARHVHNVKK